MRKRTIAGLILLALAAGLVAVTRIAGANWERTTNTIREQMRASLSDRPGPQNELPEPVRRYLERAAPAPRTPVRTALIRHEGEFRMSEKEDKWSPFTSTQFVTIIPPAFDWDARIRMMPGVLVHVRDGYVSGRGVLRAAVFGLFTLARTEGSSELAQGQLMRYLAEAPWYPTALLPGQGVEWSALDDISARATIRDGAVRASVDFHFGEDGLVREITALRGRDMDGAFVETPWAGRVWEYEERHGLLVPLRGEVEWRSPAGPLPYWRGRIAEISYD